MDIGLYHFKHLFRKMITLLMPLVRDFHPTWVSLAILPISILVGIAYIFAQDLPFLYLVGVFGICLRLICATLDGMIAEEQGRTDAQGAVINRLIPELGDIILLGCLCLSYFTGSVSIILVLSVAWLTSYAGIIGLVGNLPIQSVGPVGQTDRLVVLILFSLLQYLFYLFNWNINIMPWFLWWSVVGGIVTIANRLFRTFEEG